MEHETNSNDLSDFCCVLILRVLLEILLNINDLSIVKQVHSWLIDFHSWRESLITQNGISQEQIISLTKKANMAIDSFRKFLVPYIEKEYKNNSPVEEEAAETDKIKEKPRGFLGQLCKELSEDLIDPKHIAPGFFYLLYSGVYKPKY
eukprot:UN26349